MSGGAVLGIFSAIIGVAFLTVALGSPHTSGIIKSIFDGFTGALKASMGH